MAQFDSGSGGSGTDTTEESTEPETDATQTSPSGTTATLDGGGTTTQPPETGGPQTGPGPGDGGPQTASGGPTQTTATGTGTGGADTEPAPDRGDPVDAGDQPDVARDLAQQLGSQLDRDVSPDQLDIRRVETDDGTRFVARPGGRLRAAMSREQARQAGVNLGARGERAELLAQLRSGGPALQSGRVEVSTGTIREAEQAAQGPRSQGVDVEAVERVGQAREAVESARRAAGARLSGAAAAASAAGRAPDTEEQFGDFPVQLDLTPEPGGAFGEARGFQEDEAVRLEDVLGAGADRFSSTLEDLTQRPEGAGEQEVVLESAIAQGLEQTGRDQLAEDIREFEASLVRGGGEILNVPATAVGLKEGFEFIGFGAQETAAGRGEEFFEESTAAGREAVQSFAEQARDEPVETGAFLGGALLGSAGIIRGASRVSPRAGRAAAFAIQPGEELIGTAGFRATRAVAGEGTAQKAFPNQEPLIFSEEAAIRRGRQLTRRARQSAEQTRDLIRGDVEVSPSPRQRRLIERFAPGERTGADPTLPGERPNLLDPDVVDVAAGRRPQAATSIETRRRSAIQLGEFEISPTSRVGAGLQSPVEIERVEPELEPTRSEVLGGGAAEQMRLDLIGQQKAARRMLGGEFEGRFDPVGRSTPVRGRFGFDTETRAEVETDLGVGRLEFAGLDQDVQSFEDVRFDVRPDARPGVDVDTDQQQQTDIDIDSEVEPRPEIDSEAETETELDSPFRLESSESETEFESEFELGSELEAEFEAMFPDSQEQRRLPSLNFGAQSATFGSGIEDVTREDFEDLFGGDDRIVRDPLAGLEGFAPDDLGGGLDDLAEEFDQAFNGDNQ